MKDLVGFRQHLEDNYPEYEIERILHKNKESIEKSSAFFSELVEIYENREKYNLHWAYENASNSFNLISNQITSSNLSHNMNEEIFVQMKETIAKKIDRTSRNYFMLSKLTMLLDIFISVILILAVTLIAQFAEKRLESIIISILFVAFIALLKVSLDRFFIIPRIEKWGWKKYKLLTDQVTVKFRNALALNLIIKDTLKKQVPLEQVYDLINRNKIEVDKEIKQSFRMRNSLLYQKLFSNETTSTTLDIQYDE